MAVVYQHIREDTGLPFYVGIGKHHYRSTRKWGRNPYWNNIVKNFGYYVEILYDNISYENALDIEKLLIKKYGRKDNGTGILANMTDGGEGNCNPSNSQRKKISSALKGVVKSKEHKANLSIARKGFKPSEEVKKKLSESQKKRCELQSEIERRKNMAKGEKNSNCKLTEKDVKWIRKNYIPKSKIFGQIALSEKYGVTRLTISRIINNKNWKVT